MTMDEDIPRAERDRRVLYSLLLPVVALAKWCRVPLKDVLTLAEMAYFHELRSDGRTLDEIGDVLGVSKRTTARLSKRLKSNFFRPEREHELPRRIDFMLWAEPMSLARITRELRRFPEDEVEAALKQLIEEGRVVEEPGRVTTYTVTRKADSLVRSTWTTRIGALNSLTRHIGRVVRGRFFRQEPTAFARTLSFRIRPEDLPVLEKIYKDGVWERLKALEEEADDPGALSMNLSICWAEYDDEEENGS